MVDRSKTLAGRTGKALALGAVLALVAVTATSAATGAHLARTVTINETGHLHLTSHSGFTLNEQGTTGGTIAGTIYLHLHIVATNRVTAEVNIYPHGSSITGRASGSYRSAGATASFTGTMSVIRGSGAYAHASGSGLHFSGTVARVNDAVTVHVRGSFRT
jgi:hypothetical protein